MSGNKSSYLWLYRHSHSFKSSTNVVELQPLNFASRLLAKLRKLSISLTWLLPRAHLVLTVERPVVLVAVEHEVVVRISSCPCKSLLLQD